MPKSHSQTTLELTQNLNISSFHKLILLSINYPCLPGLFLTLAFIWSQFQLLTLFTRTIVLCLFKEKIAFCLHPVILAEKYLFSSNLFDEKELPRVALGMLVLAFIYLISASFVMLYIFYALNQQITVPSFLLKLWKGWTDLHALVIFFPLHINTVQLILNFPKNHNYMRESLADSIQIFAWIVLIYNLIQTLTLKILCYSNLKTPNPLSAKINCVNVIELLVKSALPFFIYHEDQSISKVGKVILTIAIALYCLYRDSMLLGFLPYYQLKTLKIASTAHAIITSMVLAGILARLFCEIHDGDWKQYRVMVLLWVVFGPALIKLYKSYVENKLLRILQNPEKIKNGYHLVHYWEIYKFYAKYGFSEVSGAKVHKKYFDFLSITGGAQGAEEENREVNNMKKKMYFMKNIELLKEFIKRYPGDSWLVELVLAKIYTKQESSCALAAHIVTNQMNKNFFERISLMMIKLRILNKLRSRKIDGAEALQIANFIHLQDQYKKLRKEMIRNIDYHVKFWRAFSSTKPSLVEMIAFAKRNIETSKNLKGIFNQCKDFKKVYFSEPLLTCSLYCYFFQDDTLLAGNLLKEYFLTEQKIKELNEKSQDNLTSFTTEALHLIVSSEQNKLGEILDCSGPISSVLGYPKDLLVGKSINILIPPVYAKHHNYFMKTYSSSIKEFSKDLMNKTRQTLMLVQDGYVSPGIIHISLSYMEGFELCYNVFLECVKDDRRLMFLDVNGGISSCSENFAKDMGFREYRDRDQFNMRDFCGESFFLEKMGIHDKKNEKENNEESLISTVFEKEMELSFYPFWSEDKEIEPIIYTAKVKKLEIQGTEIFEVELHKVSNFSFTPPPGILEQQIRLRKPSDSHGAMFRIDSEVPPVSPYFPRGRTNKYLNLNQKIFQTLQTQEAPYSPKSTTQRLLSPKSPKLEKNFEFTIFTVGTEAPMMRRETTLNNQQTQPGPLNGDEDSFCEQKEEVVEVVDYEMLENFNNHNEEEEEEEHKKEDLLEDIFGNSSTESGNTKLENTKFIQRQKVVKRLVRDRTHRTETKFYIASFAITCLALLILLIWLNFYTSTTSKNVRIYSDALQNAYFRSYWTKIANQDTLYWLGAMIEWVNYDPEILTDGFNKSFHKASFYNQALEKSISLITPELQEMHYKKNVRIYDRDIENNKVLVGHDDTFQATKRIFSRGMTNFQRATTGYDFEEKINQDSYFIFDNSLNDLQIQEARLILAIKDHLFGIFEASRDTMIRYMGVVFGIVFFFMVFSLKYTISVNIGFRNFINILYTLRKSEVKHIENISLNFKELLEKDYQEKELFFDLYDVEKAQVAMQKAQLRENNASHAKKQQQRENYFAVSLQDSLKEVYSRNLLLFSGLFVFTGLTVGFAFLYFSQSSNKLNIMQKQQVNINSALDFVNSLSWVTTEIQLISLFNFSMPTRNIPIVNSIMGDIEQLKDVTTLQNSLRNEKGEFAPAMQTILFNPITVSEDLNRIVAFEKKFHC